MAAAHADCRAVAASRARASCPHPGPLAQHALSRLLTLAMERTFDRLCTHAAGAEEGSGGAELRGCAYLRELAGSVLSTLVVLLGRQVREGAEPQLSLSLHPKACPIRTRGLAEPTASLPPGRRRWCGAC